MLQRAYIIYRPKAVSLEDGKVLEYPYDIWCD